MKHDNITASQRIRQWFDHAGQYQLITKNHIHDGPNPLSKSGGFAEECENKRSAANVKLKEDFRGSYKNNNDNIKEKANRVHYHSNNNHQQNNLDEGRNLGHWTSSSK